MVLRALTPAGRRLGILVGSRQFHRIVASSLGEGLPAAATAGSSDAKWIVEKLWLEFFSDPSQWWDNRTEKVHGITFVTPLLVDAEN
jgi:hypothetical protein